MSKFRKKPVEIDAVCWNGEKVGLTNKPYMDDGAKLEKPDWMPPVTRLVDERNPETDKAIAASVPTGEVWRRGDFLFIGTLEGGHVASPGDWVIRGVKGELYPCKPDIFEATYDPV